jgi:hypothetical protein
MVRGHYMDRRGQVPHVMQHNALVCMRHASISDTRGAQASTRQGAPSA